MGRVSLEESLEAEDLSLQVLHFTSDLVVRPNIDPHFSRDFHACLYSVHLSLFTSERIPDVHIDIKCHNCVSICNFELLCTFYGPRDYLDLRPCSKSCVEVIDIVAHSLACHLLLEVQPVQTKRCVQKTLECVVRDHYLSGSTVSHVIWH